MLTDVRRSCVLAFAWQICAAPKKQHGQTVNGTGWCGCCAVFWIVCVVGVLFTGGTSWFWGPFFMIIPFCCDGCCTFHPAAAILVLAATHGVTAWLSLCHCATPFPRRHLACCWQPGRHGPAEPQHDHQRHRYQR